MTRTFETTGDFAAMREAERWLADHGYSVGPCDHRNLRGVLKGDFGIAKWHNLTDDEIAQLDGRMGGNMRHGPVWVEIEEAAACTRE